MNLVSHILLEAWNLLLESSVYILLGLLVSGLLRVFLNPSSVARHFGGNRFGSVLKAGLLGVPIPLCSCGVLPAAVSLRKQGAGKGAATAFLISTPESGVDSIAITYALLDPVMTVARPVVALITGTMAGLIENLFPEKDHEKKQVNDLSCPVDACCDGNDCSPDRHKHHHSNAEKVRAGFSYAFGELWRDMAPWFFLGLLLAGAISALVPTDIMGLYLGGGLVSMLLMMAVGIPMYICATASTPIAAALVLKGVSPGAALVFLMLGPATNLASITVLARTFGKRTTGVYLGTIALSALLFGLALDGVYDFLGISAQAQAGKAAELIPLWAKWAGAAVVCALSAGPVAGCLRGLFGSMGHVGKSRDSAASGESCACGEEGGIPSGDLLPIAPRAEVSHGRLEVRPDLMEQPFVKGLYETPAGDVPMIISELGWRDRWGAVKARWGIGRMHYMVEPGLYALGRPGQDSPVLVTANYKMGFDRLRGNLSGRDAWILVLDTKGINVWCAAGKGTFGTEELVGKISSSGLKAIVSHRQVILPQLSAPGVVAHKVQGLSGFQAVFGPVKAEDLPEFLDSGLTATRAMRRKTFTLRERAALIPVEFVQVLKWCLILLPAFFLLGGLGEPGGFWAGALDHGLFAVLGLSTAVFAGTVLIPLLLPWLPGRAFTLKGLSLGLVCASILSFFRIQGFMGRPGLPEIIPWIFLIPALTAYLAMNFTGASTFTSLSGVRKEMKWAVPVEIGSGLIGLTLWLGFRFL